jgi:hypothetical protein
MQIGTWLGGWKFLKPTNPQETLALLIAITVLLGLGAGAAKAVEGLFRGDPWNVRADRICLRAGNEYLSVEGSPIEQEKARIEITQQALSELENIKKSVPLASTLGYGSMLERPEQRQTMIGASGVSSSWPICPLSRQGLRRGYSPISSIR